MIAIQIVIGLMIAFACFNACVGQLVNTLVGTVTSLTIQRANTFFTALDADIDGIVELKEFVSVCNCIGENLNMDEKNKKRIYEDGYTKAWTSLGFDKAESGYAFHPDAMIDIFALGKLTPSYTCRYGARGAFALLFDALRCYDNNSTITFDQFRAYHSCIQNDHSIHRVAFDKVDVNKDGAISEDELCDAGENFVLGEDEDGTGSLLFGQT